jgi:lysophospholipase L1-like esterase
MKSIFAIIIMLLMPCAIMAQERNLTILGDSRALEFGAARSTIYNAEKNGVPILAEGELSADTIVNLGIGGSTAVEWARTANQIRDYSSYVTFISIGGNDVRDLYGFLEYHKNLHSIKEALYWMWQVEVETDCIARRTKFLADRVLGFNDSNRIILSDVAPIIDYTSSQWRWQFFYLANYMLSVLNKKYQDNVVNSLQARYGQRIQLLPIYDRFLANILNQGASYYFIGYYSDFVHFGPEGLEEWGRLLATQMGVLGWYSLNNGLCASDNEPPVFVLPSDGAQVVVVPLLVNATANIDFQVNDNGELLGVTGMDSTIGAGEPYTYRLTIRSGNDNSNPVRTVVATDTCGNRTTMRCHYSIQLTGAAEVFGWPWLQYTISYHFTVE